MLKHINRIKTILLKKQTNKEFNYILQQINSVNLRKSNLTAGFVEMNVILHIYQLLSSIH